MLQETVRLLLLLGLWALAAGQDTTPEAKLQQMRDLARRSKGNVVSLDDATYPYYAVSRPRPYQLIVLLTALNPKFKCALCQRIDEEFALLAGSYRDSLRARREEPEVFFLRLDYEQASRTFQNYEAASVPVVFHIPSSQVERAGREYSILISDRMQLPMSNAPDAETMAKFVTSKTGAQFEIRRSMLFTYVLLAALFGLIVVLIPPLIEYIPLLLRMVQFKPLWMLVSASVYTCAISGFIFDIIRSPPMYHLNPQNGQRTYFYPQSGNQFVVEGFIIGFLNMACAAALIGAAVIAPRYAKSGATIPIMVCLVVFLACFLQIRAFYIMKNRWYGSARP